MGFVVVSLVCCWFRFGVCLKDLFYKYEYLPMHTICMQCPRGPEEGIVSPDTEVTLWVLAIKPRSSGRIASANWRAILLVSGFGFGDRVSCSIGWLKLTK